MKLTFLGHSAFLLTAPHIKALVDPFLSGNPLAAVPPDAMTEITHIFVTHGHGDHLGDTEMIAKKCDSLVVCNAELSFFLKQKGLRTHAMHIGGRISMEFGSVKMVPALHGSGITVGNEMIYGGNPCGFVIEADGKKVYHAGDTGLTKDMELLAEEGIHAALLPIGGNYTMDIRDAVRSVELIKPKLAIPMHYSTFELIKADPQVFKELVPGAEVRILGIGDSLEL